MCSYTASTLAIRAKCSLSFHYLCLPNDQPFCCHHPCCQFSVSPRFFSRYFLGFSSQFHSKVLFHAGRRRVRVFHLSRDFDMMGLLAEPEERFNGLGEPVCRKARREIQIESIEGKRRSSRKEEITGIRSPRRSDGLSSVCDSELNKVGRGRAGGNSLVRYDNRQKDTGYNEVDVAEEEVREVHKYVDDSWRERRYSSKRDVNLDSREDESTKRYGNFRHLGVRSAEVKTVHRANLSQQGNLRKIGLDGRSKTITKISEAQLDDELDNVKRTSVSTNVRKIEKESSACAARQNRDMDHEVAGHDQRRRTLVEQSKLADFRYNDAQSAAYRQRDFEETSIRGREERGYLEQNSSQVLRDKRIHFHGHALEQDESRRSTHRLNEVSLSRERTSPIDGKSVKVMDAIPNLAQDSSQASRDKRSQREMELHLAVENISEESEAKLIIAGNSVQLRGGERKQIDRGAVEHDKTRRNSQMLGEVSEVYSVNMEAFSLSSDTRGNSYAVQSSIPAKKDKGTQVEMHDLYYDQIEMPGFNANKVVNATSSWNSPASRVDIQEYSPLLASNQISSIRKQNDQASKHAYLLYDAQMEFERSTSEFDLERSNNIRISNSNEMYNSRTENGKAFTSTETSSYVLTQEQEEQRSSLTGESMEMTSTGNLHAISSPQPICSELNYDAGWGYQQGQYDTNYSARKLDKSSCSLAGEFVDRLQKEVVALKESGKTPNVSVGIQIGKPGRRDIQPTLRLENQNETSSTVLTQERKERLSSLLVVDNSQHKALKVASTGSLGDVSSSVKIYSEVDNHRGRDDIRHITHDTIESAFDKSSAFRSDDFVDEIPQEIMSLNESGKEPSVSSRIQIEETGGSQSEGTAVMPVGERSDSRGYGDDRQIKEGGRLSSSGSGMRGPSDEMWGDEIQFSQENSKAEEAEEDSPTSEAMDLTAPTLENAITRRSPKSLWSFLADIIQMSWILRGNSHSSTLNSAKRASSNESLSSEAWFSGPEPDEDGAGDESQETKQIGLLKDSGVVTGSFQLPLQELKKGDSLAVMEPDSSISSGFMTTGLSARTASSSVEADNTQYSKSSQGSLSNVAIVEQQLESALPSTSGIVESRVRDKVKVLKQSASYPAAVMRVGFSSAITQETGAEQMEAAQIGKDDNSSLKVDSALPRITDPEEVDRPGVIPLLELDPFGEKLPEVGGIKATGIKQRKFQRKKHVPSEQFDEWEKAFKLENEQKKLDEFFMREAILDAKKASDAWEVPVGAVLVQNGKIIARGCNMVEELRDSTAHAEMICIREASNLIRSWRLSETTLYVTLEPCPMCAGAILQARIDTVVWGAPNRLLGADGSWVRLFPSGDGGGSSMNPPSQMTGPVHPFHPNIKIRRGVLETECGDVMQQFFKLRRKKDKKPESSPPPSYLPLSNRPDGRNFFRCRCRRDTEEGRAQLLRLSV